MIVQHCSFYFFCSFQVCPINASPSKATRQYLRLVSKGIMLEDLVNSVTTVHGLSYLVDRGKSERIFWLFCIVASFSFATHVIVGNVVQWENEPSSVVSVQPVLARLKLNFKRRIIRRNWFRRRVSALVFSNIFGSNPM